MHLKTHYEHIYRSFPTSSNPHQNFLNFPDYTYKKHNNPGSIYNFDEFSLKHYHVNAGALLLVGKYMDFLKENGIWNNTRIIIVADHGRNIYNPKLNSFENQTIMAYNPLLMVKDFNAKGSLKTSKEFMTNADVPILATKGIIKNPENPFNNKALSNKEKLSGLYIITNHKWPSSNYEGITSPIFDDDEFYYVKDNIFKPENWEKDIPAQKVTPFTTKGAEIF